MCYMVPRHAVCCSSATVPTANTVEGLGEDQQGKGDLPLVLRETCDVGRSWEDVPEGEEVV